MRHLLPLFTNSGVMPLFFSNSVCQLLSLGTPPLPYRIICNRLIANINEGFRTLKAPWRILFFGSDDFSEASLKMLYAEMQTGETVDRIDVVTSLKSKSNPVRTFAEQNNLCVHRWPYSTLKEEFHVGVVVSFGHLIPERIITSFPLGMLNVHASLLPRWRGAAPIIHAILHGDTTTGVSIMRIKPKRFDIGDVVKQESCAIFPDETLPQLYSRLAVLGARVLVECVRDLPHCLAKAVPQPNTNITYAPKVSPAMAVVRWEEMTSAQVHNLHRALSSVHPLTTTWHGLPVRLYCAMPATSSAPGGEHCRPGCVQYLRSAAALRVLCADRCWVHFVSVGVPNKKPLSATEFNNGYLSKKKESERIFT